MITLVKKIVSVPDEFTPKENRPYPVDNLIPFEEWFFRNYDSERNNSDRIYLPIQFTAFYCNHKHGRDRKAMNRLQVFLNSLDRSKKYFCCVQYDDGVLNDVKHLDLLKFGMGCTGDVQLPLVCQPHKYEFKETGRPIFASFVGSITHPIRSDVMKPNDNGLAFVSTELTSLHSYCYIMSQSEYALCPRGYGKTSFRIMEALQYGATPIYISDEFLFSKGCICINSVKEVDDAIEKHKLSLKRNADCVKANKDVFNTHYTYEAVANRIYENL